MQPIENPNARKVGLEIEFVVEREKDTVDLRNSFGDLGLVDTVSRDSSIKPYGLELRTIPFLPGDFTIGLLKSVLTDMRHIGTTNSSCGLHIHVDFNRRYWQDYLGRERFGEQIKIAWLTEANTNFKEYVGFLPFESRYSYAHPTFSSYRGDRYAAVNYQTIYNTLEIRMFNAHLSLRWICRAIRCAIQITDRIELALKKLA